MYVSSYSFSLINYFYCFIITMNLLNGIYFYQDTIVRAHDFIDISQVWLYLNNIVICVHWSPEYHMYCYGTIIPYQALQSRFYIAS